MIPPALSAFLIRWGVIALAILAAYGGGRLQQALADERAQDTKTLQAWRDTDAQVAGFIQDILELRGPARRRAGRERLDRVCDGSMRSPRGAHEGTGGNASDRSGHGAGREELTDDLFACQENKRQLIRLQEALRPQLDR